MEAEACSETILYTPVEILAPHHKRLCQLVPDAGPIGEDGKYIIPSYLFLSEKPMPWFWGVTGVVRRIRGTVSEAELLRVKEEHKRITMGRLLSTVVPDYMENALIEVHASDGSIIASVNMFGRRLITKVFAAHA
jgi:hypothetical protein